MFGSVAKKKYEPPDPGKLKKTSITQPRLNIYGTSRVRRPQDQNNSTDIKAKASKDTQLGLDVQNVSRPLIVQ